MDEPYTQRFGGIGRLYGAAALPRLEKAHVAIVGVGGVGSWVVEALARSGVGALTLIDMDDVCITNTNRQLPALAHTVGHSKVEVLAARVAEINPACRVNRCIEFLTESNVARLLEPAFDFVVDAVDRTSIKALIIAQCCSRGLPVITSGSAGGRRDPTLIKITDLGHAGTDPLLKGVRQCLRRNHGFAKSAEGRPLTMNVSCVFSTEKPVYPWADGSCSVEPEQGAEAGLRLDCAAGFGAATFVTGAFGFALAAEVVSRLTAR
ncbi:tRNA threonylcarbamoyladenosine dehydratase [Prosthecobacter sp.]|uniref:tRNA threonylcarbamoyladenosine dehydratase n=1 Tax=Prosthecobacter sp. TaxID=1965333 RepID=UPI001D72BDD4|nr:tRNA threonylcarbamoyladenosine dehydratase [Prosthecobacter sp.]MCB1276812.1 tRNA threonylcarbamoyladenosine dehydratase [Prosthecobacter sp.]